MLIHLDVFADVVEVVEVLIKCIGEHLEIKYDNTPLKEGLKLIPKLKPPNTFVSIKKSLKIRKISLKFNARRMKFTSLTKKLQSIKLEHFLLHYRD